MKNKKIEESGFEDMPTEKICRHRSHSPPKHLYIPPGKVYRHVCPGCGQKIILRRQDMSW